MRNHPDAEVLLSVLGLDGPGQEEEDMTLWQFIVDIAVAIGAIAALVQLWQKYQPQFSA